MITFIIPVRNESAYIFSLCSELDLVFADVDHQILLADDSDPLDYQQTLLAVQSLDSVTVIHGTARRSLAKAVVETSQYSVFDTIVVLDGDGQHSPRDVRLVYDYWTTIDKHSLVVASRFKAQSLEGLNGIHRKFATIFLTLLVRCFRRKLRVTTDPLAGCFLAPAYLIQNSRRSDGFKLLLSILLNLPDSVAVHDVGLVMKSRTTGISKMSPSVAIEIFRRLL